MTGASSRRCTGLRVLFNRLIVHNELMKFRIGYGGPRQHRHGQYRPGGRRNNGGMSEVERLIHLIASMQILFGSRRGGWVVPLVLIGLAAGGWYAYTQLMNPDTTLEKAHVMYDSPDTGEQIKAIAAYKRLLNKSDPLEPERHWLRTDRDTLYRRVIKHEVLNAENEDKAGEWAIQAIEDGFTNLRFQNERVKKFWEKTLGSFRKGKQQPTHEMKPETSQQQAEQETKQTTEGSGSQEDNRFEDQQDREPGKFDVLPGLDDTRVKNIGNEFALQW